MQQPGLIKRMAQNCSAFLSVFLRGLLRQRVLTRENAWVLLIALMIILILTLGTMGVQPRFVYSGF